MLFSFQIEFGQQRFINSESLSRLVTEESFGQSAVAHGACLDQDERGIGAILGISTFDQCSTTFYLPRVSGQQLHRHSACATILSYCVPKCSVVHVDNHDQ